jgi:hypothetical protein
MQQVPFTAGDLVEGLSFMEPTYRMGALFGLETGLTAVQVTDLTFSNLKGLEFKSELGRAVLAQRVRHLRLPYVFWLTLENGLAMPLMYLEEQVRAAFGGMSWSDLQRAYDRMVWIDDQVESDCFWRDFNAATAA